MKWMLKRIALLGCLVCLFGMSVQASYGGVTGGGCVIKYMDGCGGTVFDDVQFEVKEGTDTPQYTGGTPHRDGYEFMGWSPEVAAKVESDITYVAQWRKPSDSNSGQSGDAGTAAGGTSGTGTSSGTGTQSGNPVSQGVAGATTPQQQVSQDVKTDEATPNVDTWDVNLTFMGIAVICFALAFVGCSAYGIRMFRIK